ncbi:RagB/SusD family nutrient uptake outer membrane protein [Prevotella sp. 10(H)]|uniref:RagB/SusD family nutrient uptake outer membrane protein n=1 Tax=Prevotella sp. 10(H) TaxID=1158294 RepID=UPI0004A6DCB7|nr:RagB/SusD family nutrient uptake outer membrane protein [Prevotella sp. 10(H)]
MKKILIILLCLPFLHGCDDFLEPEQINLVYNEVFWKKQSDAEIGLLGTYALYRALMIDSKNWYQRGDATTGFLKKGWNGGSPDALYRPGDFSSVSSDQKSWGGLEDYADWSNFYKVIAQANLVIAKIDEIPEDKFSEGGKDKLLGEAYFLRALVYFNILRIWGNAPYISEAIESSTQVIDGDLTPIMRARTKDIEIAGNVLSDVNNAVSKLKYSSPGDEGWGIRANKASAEALAGHANMWMHFLAQRDGLADKDQYLTAAITALESLRTNGNYSYVDYTREDAIEKLYKGGSTEAVFELNISYDQNESYRVDRSGVESFTCKLVPLDNDETKDRASYINFIPKSQKSLMYPEYDINTGKGDVRANLFFKVWDSPYEDPFSDVSQTSTDRNLVTWMQKYNMVTVDPMRAWNEYIAYFAEANIPVFRYTDVSLLLAEAYCKINQQGKALPIVNEIRSRAGLGAYSGSDLLKEVLQQRICELFGEGHLFFDMVRNNYFPNQQVMEKARYDQQGYYWPVSSYILTSNKQVSQTPYWNGKTKW